MSDIAEITVFNPATGEAIASVPDLSRSQLDAVVARARAAFPAWAARSYDERRQAMNSFADLLLEHVGELKSLLTSEQGKPLGEAELEVIASAYYIKGMAALELPATAHVDFTGRRVQSRRVPLGVAGAITPWNFPLVLAVFKIAPALLTGNTMVLKPSPFTPLSTLRMVELAAKVLPADVLQVVTGGDQLGPWLTSHTDINKISFTGSTQTGRKVMAHAADTLKRITLELGGNDAAIVLPDVDVAAVAEKLFWGAFTNAGQICIAIKRLYIHQDIYHPLKQALIAYAAGVKVGNGADAANRIGPLNNRAQYDRVQELLADSRAQGYTLHSGEAPTNNTGLFIAVTLVDNPPENARIVQEEQFGPVLPLLQFADIDDAVARANASPFGLGGSVWSADENLAASIAARLDAGVVWVNDAGYLEPSSPFGGHKQSGVGAEGGVEALMEYTQSQTLFLPATS